MVDRDWLSQVAGRAIGPRVPLVGGITATVERVALAGGTSVVLKTYASDNPEAADLVRRDAAALEALAGSGIPAPTLLGFDTTGAEAGLPAVVMTSLAGEPALTHLARRVDALAAMHVRIHALPPRLTSRSDGWFDDTDEVGWIADAGLRRDALAAVSPSGVDPVFVHGDYQPCNVLFSGDAITGVVDWAIAGTGSRGVDVGHCLLNLAVLDGPDTADAYLDAYERAAGVTVAAGSRLRALLTWDRDWQRFIPVQLAGRAPVDVDGMSDRVTETVRRTLS